MRNRLCNRPQRGGDTCPGTDTQLRECVCRQVFVPAGRNFRTFCVNGHGLGALHLACYLVLLDRVWECLPLSLYPCIIHCLLYMCDLHRYLLPHLCTCSVELCDVRVITFLISRLWLIVPLYMLHYAVLLV